MRLHFEYPDLIAFAVHPGSVVTENRTEAAKMLGVEVEGSSIEECVTGMTQLVSSHLLRHCSRRGSTIGLNRTALTLVKLDRASLTTSSGTFVNIDGTPIPW
jgi:norsolorinic acid ketoreductase